MNKCVYAYFYKDECFYIGIGNRCRANNLKNRNKHCVNKIQKAQRENSFYIQILHTGLSWEMACWYEVNYIRTIGRKDLGIGSLLNMTDGGEGMPNPSPEYRSKLSELKKGEKNHFYGRTHSEEVKHMISEKASKRMRGENNHFYGKHHSKETKEHLRQLSTGRKMSKETKHKISESNTGEKNYFYGKTHTKESKEKISKANKGRKHSEEYKRNKSKSMIGKKNHFYGKTHTQKTKNRISKTLTGRKLSEETKNKLSKLYKDGKIGFKGKKHKESSKNLLRISRSRNISTPKGRFLNAHEAAKQFDISHQTIRRRCDSDKWTDWYYIDK